MPTTSSPTLLLTLATIVVTLGYLASCAVWPYTRCRRCHGTGKLTSPLNRRAVRYCPHCHNTGLRLRPGRRLLTGASTHRRRRQQLRTRARRQP